MKTTKRLIAMAAALTLTACAAAPITMMNVSAASIEITGISTAKEHTFEAYQIFTGTLNTDKTFKNLKWGNGISKYDGTDVSVNELVPTSIIDEIVGLTGTEFEKSNTVISKITKNSTASATITSKNGETFSDKVTFNNLADGYYLVLDTTNLDDENDANSAYILKVADTTTVAIKKEKPSVDKQVYDNADGTANAGWGESADHAINENFKFKLIATIPANDDLQAYEEYKIKFNDKMSTGVTFKEIDSVKISSSSLTGDNIKTLTSSEYDATEVNDNNEWSLTINNVKGIVNSNTLGDNKTAKQIFGKEIITVEVEYTACLNENAILSKTNLTNEVVNNNKVNLQYSNNPDNTGTGTSNLGKTPDDYVWVFTYEVDNTKYRVKVDDTNKLAGAKFQIKKGNAVINLIDNKDGSYTVADQSLSLTAETDLLTTDKPIVDTMISSNNGIFNIKGLDAGTYTLTEKEAPSPYNKADDITITISADHKENTSLTSADLSLDGSSNMTNQIVDSMNNALPTTGGTGTKVLYAIGGTILVGAGMVLVSKKRAQK